jgi:hypothetical protein
VLALERALGRLFLLVKVDSDKTLETVHAFNHYPCTVARVLSKSRSKCQTNCPSGSTRAESAFQFNRLNASDVTMADPPSDQSRHPLNHLLRSPPVRDVTIDASRAGFDTGRPHNRVMEVTEFSNLTAPIPPPPPPPQTPSTHPLTSAAITMVTTPLEGVGEWDSTGQIHANLQRR